MRQLTCNQLPRSAYLLKIFFFIYIYGVELQVE